MRIRLMLALLLLPLFAYAQERYNVSGRIVNENGEAVEYVQVGIPKLGIGTVSSADGHFEIKVPKERLEFHHVSYQIGYYTVTGHQDDVVIVLKENELPPAVVIGGKSREKYLIRAGTRFPGAAGSFDRTDGVVKGIEVGSVANTRKPFLIKDIQFTVLESSIPGCVASVNIYRIEGKPEEFINILHKPIYVNIALSNEKKQYNVHPDDNILLEPGRYYISFELVDCDMDAVRKYQQTPESERDPGAFHLLMALYFKSSYQRNSALGEFIHIPFNIGLVVKGLEFQ